VGQLEKRCDMFWLGFLFGDENRKLKELERSRKQRELEEEEKKVSIMVEDFEIYARGNDGDFSCFYDLDYDKSGTKKEVYLY